jgi:hypothetical protein
VVASLLLVAALGKEHDCTVVATFVVAGTVAAGIAGDCPNTAMEGDTSTLRVGYRPYDTLEEHH